MLIGQNMSVDWIRLSSQRESDTFLNTFGGFHDGCFREAHMWTGEYVYRDLSMKVPGRLNTNVRMLFQRQWNNPSAIEMLFEQGVTFHVYPTRENEDPAIYCATLILEGELFYWASHESWAPTNDDRDKATWIAAKRIWWRDASDWMGENLRYCQRPPEELEQRDH